MRKTVATLFFEIFSAPVWWYTGGIRWIAGVLTRSARRSWENAGVGVWMKNLFVPMYGQSDAWGRIISFLIRFVNIVARMIWFALWAAMLVICFIVWIAAPLITIGIFIYGLQTYA